MLEPESKILEEPGLGEYGKFKNMAKEALERMIDEVIMASNDNDQLNKDL
jgi:hypothetical protein